MRAVIEGLRYDTETATRICDISPSGFYRSDFRWEDTDLYKTPRGRYFIAGEGNALSRWATREGQSASGPGRGIRVVTEEEARELVERHGTTELYERTFGEAEAA
jgi:hypothetical protein